MKPHLWQDVRRIVAIRLDNIGNVVLLSPALKCLRETFPDAHIVLMTSPEGSQVAPLFPWINEVLVHRPVWLDVTSSMPLDPGRELELVQTLRSCRFDAAVLFTDFTQSPYPAAHCCYLAGIPLRLGQSREFGGGLLSHWVNPLPDVLHQSERNLHLLEADGFTVGERSPQLNIPDAVQADADGLLRNAGLRPGDPFIVLAPGAGCDARRYDPENYATAVRSLSSRTDLPVLITGSEAEKELCDFVQSSGQRYSIVSLAGETTVPELAAIVRRSSLVITSNSGCLHIADALKRPVIALYSGRDMEGQLRPRHSLSRVLTRPTACSPCYHFRCPSRKECLAIPPEEIVNEALDVLNQAHQQNVRKETRGSAGPVLQEHALAR